MKVLKIHFQNLNSLKGEWLIDFTHPAYLTGGIFGITGPTGSGKTTLLDALCLALYGRTPRLRTISKSANDALTRGAGLCFSEVTFETMKGSFRCHWSQHRARKSPSGDLQQPRHEIIDNSNDKILQNKIKEVARVVEEVTGMSFEQFTRSILLAQGNFAAFLQAPPDDRAPILEQITGTDIYSRISQKVYEQTASEEKIYRTISGEISSLQLHSEEEKKHLQEKLTEEQSLSDQNEKKISEIQKLIQWRQNLERFEEEIATLEKDAIFLEKQLEEMAPKRTLLKKAYAAELLTPVYKHFEHLRKTHQSELAEKTQAETDQPILINLRNQTKSTLIDLGKQISRCSEDLLRERKICKTVRALDVSIQEIDSQKNTAKSRTNTLCEQQTQIENRINALSTEISATHTTLEGIKTYLDTHKDDEKLVESFSGIQEKARQIALTRKKQKDIANDLINANALIREKEIITNALKEKHARAKNNYLESKTKYDSLQRSIGSIREKQPRLGLNIEAAGKKLQIYEKICALLREKENLLRKTDVVASEKNTIVNDLEALNKKADLLREQHVLQGQLIHQQETIAKQESLIKNLEAERRKLQPGSPCPLCGSKEHCFSQILPTKTTDTVEVLAREKEKLVNIDNECRNAEFEEKIGRARLEELKGSLQEMSSRIEEIGDEISSLTSDNQTDSSLKTPEDFHTEISNITKEQKDLCKIADDRESLEEASAAILEMKERLNGELTAFEKDLAKAEFDLEKNISLRNELDCQLEDLQKSKNAAEAILFQELKPYQSRCSFENIEVIITDLSKRLLQWKNSAKNFQQLQQKLVLQKAQLNKEKALLDKTAIDKENSRKEVDYLHDKLTANNEVRRQLYQTKDPDEEEKKKEGRLADLEKKKDEIESEDQTVSQKLLLLNGKLDRLTSSTALGEVKLEEERAHFQTKMQQHGFKDVDDYIHAKMSGSQITDLEKSLLDLDEQYNQNQTLLQEKKRHLLRESEKKLTLERRENLDNQLSDIKNRLNTRLQVIGRLKAQVEDNDRRIKDQQKKLENLNKQEKELARWQKLNLLIGSASGKKFRNFAQGITFEIMVAYANRSLQKMTDRYILIRDTSHPLDLNVVDNYRAGDVRSTKNLSGGEAFLVSLSLALGLSNMAGKNIRVDSLFLDEGFGTLDEETLETAIQALAGLQHEGKTIGIISHVSLLKERLPTQIKVIPTSGGHSSIKGPGIHLLS